MKRHHEENHYGSNDGGGTQTNPSKRMTTKSSFQSNDEQSQINSIEVNLSPSSSTESDSSSRSSLNSCQLCRCPSNDCVIHHRQSNEIPEDLRSDRNPTYGSNNLLLHYAHLERCRRYGTNLHLSSSSS